MTSDRSAYCHGTKDGRSEDAKPGIYTLEFAGQIPAFNQWALFTHWHITCELAEVGDACVRYTGEIVK